MHSGVTMNAPRGVERMFAVACALTIGTNDPRAAAQNAASDASFPRATLDQYCVTCHNERSRDSPQQKYGYVCSPRFTDLLVVALVDDDLAVGIPALLLDHDR